jgi:rhodanese-related sulfurtransferase
MAGAKYRIWAVASTFAIFWMLAQFAWAADVPRISKEELKSMLNDPEVVILDVRASGDWDNSERKIQGAVREDPNNSAKSWADKYSKDKTIVLYCA